MDEAQPQGPADLVALNGTVLVLDERNTRASALAVRQGRVVALGTEATRARMGPDTRVLDLAGRTVIPGMNDSHLHATWLGAVWPNILMAGGTVHGEQFIHNGVQCREAILRAGKICAELGITSYTEPGLGPGEDDGPTGCFSQTVLNTYAELAQEGALRSRVTVLRLFGALDGTSFLEDVRRGIQTVPPPSVPGWCDVVGVKIFADGVPPGRSAWTRHRYPDGTRGGLLVDGADSYERARNLRGMINAAHAAGLQVGVHATGDRSVDVVLDAVGQAVREHGPGRRHYIVHGDLITPEQLERMARLGVGVTMQPGIATATGATVAAVLGADVARNAWPLANVLDADIVSTLSSDAPVTTPDWRVHLAAALDLLGEHANPELMTRLLRRYTIAPAVQDGAATWKGTLHPGKVADFCVLERDPLTATRHDLPHLAVDATVVGGHLVHLRDDVDV